MSKGTYGAPRVHADLADAGLRHGRKRVARLMRCAGLAGKSPRRWRTTTVSDPHAGRRPDLVNRDFGTDPAVIETRWCGDITYIKTWQGWLYLATVIDLASRRVVGWAVAEHLRTDLIDAALTDALVRRRPPSGLVSTPTAAVNTPAANTPASPLPTASAYPSAGAGSAGTAPSPSRSSPPSKPNCYTASPGPPTALPGRQYSSTSKAGTTPAVDTPPSATSAPPRSRPPICTSYRQAKQPE
ncbi:IS3 family transposase [Micromonospora noduli]|nr:IS3 family transposase [Micromonospora noduli]RAO46704.1 Transposase InsF for insertion sequence IS3A [Micromonospora noduli]